MGQGLSPTRTSRLLLRDKFKSKQYRDAFVRAYTRDHIAAQLFTLRLQNSYTQKKLAELAGMTQKSISELEDPNKPGININTLFRLASTFDVPLIVKFGSYDEFFCITSDDSYDALAPATFDMYEAQKTYTAIPTSSEVPQFQNQVTQPKVAQIAEIVRGDSYRRTGVTN